MIIRDRHIDPNSVLVRRALSVGITGTASLTNAVVWLYKAPHDLRVLGAALHGRTYTATGAYRLYKASADEILIGPTLAIDAVAEKFKLVTKTAVGLLDGKVFSKAPATAIVFSAAHTVNAALGAGTAHWGAILVMVNAAGTVSTKVISADQDYATEALAIAALPATDASKLAIGYITVQAKTGGLAWTANTDDLTAASDVTAANFYSTADTVKAITDSLAPVAGDQVDATIAAGYQDVDMDDYLVLLATTDGTLALVDGRFSLDYRAKGFRGQG